MLQYKLQTDIMGFTQKFNIEFLSENDMIFRKM